ncbi:MAG: Hsp20/alpha crystallin family protein [Candidatus Dormibacter sp.]
MTLTSFNPWNDLFSTQGHAEQLLGDAFGRTLMRERLVHALPLDIRQTEDAYYIEASVPGFKPEDVEITFDESVLTIRAISPQEDETKLGSYVQRERPLNSVQRHVHLPAQIRVEEITASFEYGILTIMVPREKKAQPTRIPVTMAVEPKKVIDAPVPVGSATG